MERYKAISIYDGGRLVAFEVLDTETLTDLEENDPIFQYIYNEIHN